MAQQVMTASTADGTLTVRQCTCSFTWGTDGMGHVTEVRRPGAACPTHPPAWLAALDGLCQPCADAEFYGLRMKHTQCEHGDCTCAYVIPAEWPPGTWPAS